MPEGFIPPHGDWAELLSYQRPEIVCGGTVYFCRCFLTKQDRTREQMLRASRSCKQNRVEGSMASGASKETEIKLTNAARARLTQCAKQRNKKEDRG